MDRAGGDRCAFNAACIPPELRREAAIAHRSRLLDLLWATDARLKWVAGLLTALALLCTADVPSTILLTIMNGVKIGTASILGKVLTVFVFHPAPLVLLATGVFYLWVYFRRTAESF